MIIGDQIKMKTNGSKNIMNILIRKKMLKKIVDNFN